VTKRAPTHVAMFSFPFGDLFDKNGITACISKWRKFSDISTPTQAKMGGNYLNSILATQDAKGRGFDEAILLDRFGDVSEAPGENIFLVKNDILITPPLSSSALDGITRKSIISFSKEMKLKTKIKKISKGELMSADEVFLSGTAAEITPIIKIERKKIGSGKLGITTKMIMEAYTDIVMNKNKKFAKWLTAVY
jgi:branched-chain amino acid aminotransferase